MDKYKYKEVFCLVLFGGVCTCLCDIQCKDESMCDDESTCCQMPSGQYGCCPMLDAVCCSDKLHCCPKGSTCDLHQMRCVDSMNQTQSTSLFIKLSKKLNQAKTQRMKCDIEDGVNCSLNATCCKMSSGEFGCCPGKGATCCSDGLHCCPEGTICHSISQSCKKMTPFSSKIDAKVEHSDRNILCGDGKSKCQDGTTCCKLGTGKWGCCPMPKAVCCSDGVHCCPENTKCNLGKGVCEQKIAAQKIRKVAYVELPRREQNQVVCANPGSKCPMRSTCCPINFDNWSCCSFPNAVCCKGGQHCCPENTICDMTKEQCVQNDVRAFLSHSRIPWTLTSLADSSKRFNGLQKLCPDQKQECAKTETCCIFNNTTWRCCPFPDAICCSDDHCCPKGEKCGSGGQACVSDDDTKRKRI